MFFDTKTLILLGGATASGKSEVALELATALEGEVVNADSQQLYKDLPTLTAAPSLAEQRGVPHHLYGVLEWNKTSSVMGWLSLCQECVASTFSTNAFIITGGTGLYLSTLLYGLSPIPDISDEVRTNVRQQGQFILASSGSEALYDTIAKRDPLIRGRIHPHHTQRLLRAWEVIEQTGRSIIQWQQEPRLKDDLPKSQLFVLDVDRKALGERVRKRCQAMVERGAVEEVKSLVAKANGMSTPLQRVIGFTELKAYADGRMTLDEAIEAMAQETLKYAKRQQTWFRTQYKAEDVFLLPQGTPQEQASTIIQHFYKMNQEI